VVGWTSSPRFVRFKGQSPPGLELLRLAVACKPNPSTVVSDWPCGPDSHPKPECHRQRICATRREAWATGFDRGAGLAALRALPHRPGGFVPTSLNAQSACSRPWARSRLEGWKGVRTMTRTEHDRAGRGRGELARDRGSRRVTSVIDAQRRLTARAARDAETKAHSFGPSDPRYGYLTRTYD
jgi:hypothetical protein